MGGSPGIRLRLPVWAVVAIITAVGALYRLAVWIVLDPEPSSDGIGYAMLGQNLAEGRGFVDTLSFHGLFAFWRPPFYPVTISSLYPIIGDAEFAGRLISFACSVALIPIVFVFVRDLWSDRAGLWSAVLVAGYVTLVLSAGDVAVEPLFHCLLLLLAILLWREWRAPRAYRPPVVFALAAVLYLTRFEALFYLPVAAGVVMAARIRTRTVATRGFAAGLTAGVVLFGLIASPYVQFVHRETGHWALTAAAAKNVYVGWVYSGARQNELRAFTVDGARSRTKNEIVDPRRDSGIVRHALNRPILLLEIYVANVVRHGRLLFPWWPVVLLAIITMVIAGRRGGATWQGAFLLLFILVPIAVNPFFYLEERSMRHVLLVLACAGGIGLDLIQTRFDNRTFRRFAAFETGAAFATLIAAAMLLHSARWVVIAVRYADHPASRAAMGAWMRANGFSGKLVMAPKLNVPYYAGSRYLPAPPFPADELVAYGCERNARYLVVDSRDRKPDAVTARKFRLLHEERELNGHSVRLFEIPCAP